MAKARNISNPAEEWVLLQKGDKLAFERIYRANIQPMYRFGLSITADEATVMDAIHDIFADIWQKHDRLGDTDNVKFYLLKSLKNRLLRIRSVDTRFTDLEATLGLDIDNQELVDDQQKNQEMEELLSLQILELAPRQREIIHLKFFEGLSHQQIADLLQMNPQSAKNLLHRAIESLRKNLTQFKSFILLAVGYVG
jgi:RNA polymerase sigma factor (sigma-70 family)